jgi:hypothetical protein
MKREAVLLVLGLFLMVFMIESINALTPIQTMLDIKSVDKDSNNSLRITASDGNISLSLSTIYNIKGVLKGNQSLVNSLWEPDLIHSELAGSLYIKDKDLFLDRMQGWYDGFTWSSDEKIDGIIAISDSSYHVEFKSNNNQVFIGTIQIDLYNSPPSKGTIYLSGVLFKDDLEFSSDMESRISSLESNQSLQNQRISALESWKQTISDTINTILNTLMNHESQISKIENQTITNNTIIINNTTFIVSNGTSPYFKYLNSATRKGIVCGYAQDNHLTTINDLGFNCTITYTPLRNGGEKAYCKCSGK